MKKHFIFLTALIIISILLSSDFIAVKHSIHELNKKGTLICLDIKHEFDGSEEAPVCVPILMYHSINDVPVDQEQLSVRPGDFEDQIKYIKDNGYTTITFDELKNASKYKKPIMITFDDGYVDNYTLAYSILKKYSCKATVFMVTGYINSPGFLSNRQLSEMSDLVSFQSHTVTHKKLDALNKNDLLNELRKPKEEIEKITHKPVIALAFPEGAYNKNIIDAVSKNYDYAVTTKSGYYFSDSTKYEIKRIAVSRMESLKDFTFYLE